MAFSELAPVTTAFFRATFSLSCLFKTKLNVLRFEKKQEKGVRGGVVVKKKYAISGMKKKPSRETLNECEFFGVRS